MRIKCEYCRNYILDTDEICENCGAPNDHLKRKASETPSTIEN